jgi:MFS family permease
MGLERYRAVLRTPGVARLLVLALVARTPNGMSSLAILLLVSPKQGYGRAGLAIGVYVALTGACAPIAARIVDRRGARPVLLATASGYLAVMVGLATVPLSSYGAVLALSAAAGAMQPPVIAVIRGVWARIVAPDELQVLYGLEATAQELVYIVGPALVALLAAASSPRVAVVATGALGFAGTLGLATAPALRARAGTRTTGRHRLLRSRLAVFVGLALTVTVGFSMTEIGVIAFMSGRHADAKAGIALAMWSTGSMLGGIAIGARARRGGEAATAVSMLAVAAGMGVLAAAPGRVALVVLIFAGGIAIAPALSLLYVLVAGAVPEEHSTEAFAWLGVGFLVGSSAGAAAGGFTVDVWGPRATFLLAAVLPAAGSLWLLVSARAAARTTAATVPVTGTEGQPLAS